MAPKEEPLTASELEELLRDCHPFPAYVDYIQGQPTEYELSTSGVPESAQGQDAKQVNDPDEKPEATKSSTELLASVPPSTSATLEPPRGINLTLLRLIHDRMPNVYNAITLIRQMPNHPDSGTAEHYIHSLANKLWGPCWDYMVKLVQEMDKKRRNGGVPYEAIPGWIEK